MTRSSDLRLAGFWLAARCRLVLRSPRSAFFTLVMPLVLLVVFDGLNGSQTTVAGGKVAFAQFFTPAIGVFAMVTSAYTALVFGLATAREQGILKRVRGTPLPMPIYLGSWLAAQVLMGVAAVVLMFVVAVPAFGVHVYPRMLPAALVTLVLGGATFCALALAVSSFIRRAETAPVAANLTLFPLLLVSGVFYPLEGAPHWVQTVAHVFPLSHVAQAFEACFSPYTHGSGFALRDLASIVLWGVLGATVAVRRFAAELEDGEQRRTLGAGSAVGAAQHE